MLIARLALVMLALGIAPPAVYRDTPTLEQSLKRNPSLAKSRYEGGLTLLHFAALTGDTTGAWALLGKGADPNARDALGQTPLHKCTVAQVAAMLLSAGADASLADKNDRTALEVAAAHKNKAVAEVIRRYPMVRAVMRGNLAAVQVILKADKGAVGARDWEGATPLHYVAESGNREIAEVLLANGADVNARKTNGVTPLHVASAFGRLEIISLLIARGANTEVTDGKGRTALAIAREHDQSQAEQLLQSQGQRPPTSPTAPPPPRPRIKAAAPQPMSPQATELFAAIVRMDLPRVTELLDANPSLANAADDSGTSCLVSALDVRAREIAFLLANKGADVNAPDANGCTPLFHCVDDLDLAQLLVSKGAQVKARAANGRTPLHEVARVGTPEVAELLITCGADVNAQDKDDVRPLGCAKSPEPRKEMIAALKRHGAKD